MAYEFGKLGGSLNTDYKQRTPADYKTGSYHLTDLPELYEVQRTNNFEFIVTNLDGLTKMGIKTDGTNAGSVKVEETTGTDSQNILRLSVASAQVPHFEQSVLSLRRGNSVMKFAGVPEFKAGQIKFHDFIGADTKAILMAWQNLSYNVMTENVGLMGEYKRNAQLIEYSPDYRVVRKWDLKGCWISALSEDDYNQEENNKHSITATIEYDVAYPVYDN